MKDGSIEQLTLARFQAALQSRFRVRLDSNAEVDLVLVKATGGRAAGPGGRGESFSILFKGPAHPFLPQRMYPFEHDALGKFDMFIVPVGQEQDDYLYEAVFNLSTTSS